jgi:hypothetical protein
MTVTLFAYLLCAAVSLLSAFLLYRGWRRNRSRLVYWVCMAFGFLAFSNILLVVDLVSSADFSTLRPAIIAIGLGLLIYGLVWEQSA